MNFFAGWKTRAYAAIEIILGALIVIQPDNIQLLLSDDNSAKIAGIILIVQGLARYALRQITTTPPGKSE